jgi:hypothetical protein
VRIERHVAAGRLEIAAENADQRRLAAPIGADQAVPIAVPELDGDVFDQRLCPELERDVGGSEHGVSRCLVSAARRMAICAAKRRNAQENRAFC